MLERLLYLEPGQLRRSWAFFLLYLILFAALTLADGLSLTLFVQHVGPEQLPRYYALSALCVMGAILLYMRIAERCNGDTVFVAIVSAPLVLFGLIWAAACLTESNTATQWFRFLLIGRELAFALVLLHFGNYLCEFFSRAELNRVMPAIYAGGRVGGIIAGAALEHLSALVPAVHLLLLVMGLLVVALIGILAIRRSQLRLQEPISQAQSLAGDGGSRGAFMRFVWANPLMFWITVTTILYFSCRAFLNFQCGVFFRGAFGSDAEMARFLGRYTQAALVISLLLQLLFINRWIARVGLPGAHLTYAVLLVAASLFASLEMTLATAVFIRMVEGELRYGLRNPVAQLTVNRFSTSVRRRARAWSLGLLVPVSTFAASAILGLMVDWQWSSLIAYSTAGLGLGYLLTTFRLAGSLATAETAK